jgi:hypothetical protein
LNTKTSSWVAIPLAILSAPPPQVAENTALLKEFRDNIISILGRMDAMGGVMRQMPVLPVRREPQHVPVLLRSPCRAGVLW